MSPTEVLLAVGVVQGALLAAALWLHKDGPRAANRVLALLLVSVAIGMAGHWMHIGGGWRDWPRLFLVSTTTMFLFGPLLWWYVLQLTRPLPLGAVQLWHLLPWLLNLALFIPLLMAPTDALVAQLDAPGDTSAQGMLLPALKWLSLVAYSLAGLWRLRRWRRAVEQQRANTDAINLRWLLLMLALFLSGAVLVLPQLVFGFDVPAHADTLLSFAMVAFVLAVGVAALRQPTIFSGDPQVQDALAAAVDAGPTGPANRTLSPDRSALLCTRLERAMTDDALYCDRDLSLARLAAAIGTTPHQLSELLNADLGQSFYQYVNAHRVRAVQQALATTDRSVLDLALEVGFNNKSTFNKAFREVVGTTPTAWRRAAAGR